MYLYKNDNETYFINKKGKTFDFYYDKNQLQENCYYYVLKTRNCIYEVIEKTNASWIPKEKKSYWLNFYSPMGNFEKILLLPIGYVVLLVGLWDFFMLKGLEKILGGIMVINSLYFIGYDLIYKIKLKKSNNGVDNTNFLKFNDIIKNTILIILSYILCFIFIKIFMGLSSFFARLIFLPFVGCGLCTLGLAISESVRNYQLKNIFLKAYIIIFLIYWFGFLIFWTILIVKQEENILYALFSISF